MKSECCLFMGFITTCFIVGIAKLSAIFAFYSYYC